MIKLRGYQQDALERIRLAFRKGRRSVLFQLPTGGGKTVIFSEVARSALAKGKRVCVIVHRAELLDQASRSLEALGVPHGRIRGGEKGKADEPVQIASVQTLSRRLRGFNRDRFDLLIIDEAHHAAAGSWARVIEHFDRARILGVTATPCRMDGRGLGEFFEEMVQGPPPGDLVEKGFLARARVFSPPIGFEEGKVKRRMGDFDLSEAEGQIRTIRAMGDAVSHYQEHLGEGTAIAFCCSIAHAEAVAEAFNQNGINASSIDGRMGDEERRDLLERLGRGELKVLTSCMLIGEGVDVPSVSGCILLRPTQSLSLHLQMVGRCLRPDGDKVAVILDHVGNYARHGHHLDHRAWSLEEGVRKAQKGKAPSIWVCPSCYCNAESRQMVCPECGHAKPVTEIEYVQVRGELIELNPAVERMVQEWMDEPIRLNDFVLHPLTGEGGWRVSWIGTGGPSKGWCHITDASMQSMEAQLALLKKDVAAHRERTQEEVRRRDAERKEWEKNHWFIEARRNAKTYEDLVHVGEAKGMRNPRGWARQVLAARKQAARRHPRTANYA